MKGRLGSLSNSWMASEISDEPVESQVLGAAREEP